MIFKYELKLFPQCGPCERLVEGWGLPYIVKKFVGERWSSPSVREVCVVVIGVVLLCLVRQNFVDLGKSIWISGDLCPE